MNDADRPKTGRKGPARSIHELTSAAAEVEAWGAMRRTKAAKKKKKIKSKKLSKKKSTKKKRSERKGSEPKIVSPSSESKAGGDDDDTEDISLVMLADSPRGGSASSTIPSHTLLNTSISHCYDVIVCPV